MICPECDIFEPHTRQYQICRGESELSHQKVNAYRLRWGLNPLFEEEPTAEADSYQRSGSIEFVFHGHSLGDGPEKVLHKAYGPGTELLRIYSDAGVPTCDACKELAQQMNNWGVTECRAKIEAIVADIMPRAKEWVDQKYSWVARLLPNVIEEFAIATKIRSDVNKAIDECERTIAERRSKRLNVMTGAPIQGCSSCQQSGSVSKAPSFYGRKTTTLPLVGKPIDRDRLQSHILYHVMPLAGETEWVWRRHMKWLREVRPSFGGRLIVGIVTPGQNDHWQYLSPEAVKEELAGLDAEFIAAPNHVNQVARRGIGEGVLFPQMLARLETSDPDQIAFYGHCKGVTRPGKPGDVSHRWAEVMFETLFRNQAEAANRLDSFGATGPFLMRGGLPINKPGVGPFWFFSGTFFATRLADAFARNWRDLVPYYGCVEQWPRTMFNLDQVSCLFHDNTGNLYDENVWRGSVLPELDKWRAAR